MHPDETKKMICITATFTAEPLEDALRYWVKELGFAFDIAFAPYNQVFQQLLDPTSLLSQNATGINVVLVRLEDWQRFEKGDQVASSMMEEKVKQNTVELAQALGAASSHSATPTIVCICQPSPSVTANEPQTALFQHMESLLADELALLNNIYLISSAEMAERYPVREYYDPFTDENGHIPYTTAYFTALATMLTRKIYALQTPVRKVIVLDCDNTLWKGICGESGPLGVEIDAPRRALQQFMIAQQEAGRLLCLCSKNSEQDVLDVFAQHPDMLLKHEHIISWRINWQPKSENISALAQALQLGLDSFIFVDDNPLECAEVKARCPEVLTLQLPEQEERIPRFLQHAWPFDHLKITATDRQRTTLYRQNAQREQARQSATSFEAFLATLELEIQISQMTSEHMERVAQLTQRTNQFNVSTIRRTEGEVAHLSRTGELEFSVVEVRDRFGDYGLVGVMAFKPELNVLHVDTFLLSCRVLGRGVEHRMWKTLGEIATTRGLHTVAIPFLPTPKNQPALDFLSKIGGDYQEPHDQNGWLFRVPVEAAVKDLSPSEKTSKV